MAMRRGVGALLRNSNKLTWSPIRHHSLEAAVQRIVKQTVQNTEHSAALQSALFEDEPVLSPYDRTTGTNRALADTQLVIPKWWSGTPALPLEEYALDCSSYDMAVGPEQQPQLIEQMKETYDRTGLVLLRNTGLTQLSQMSKWSSVLVEGGNYKGGANSRGAIDTNVYDTGAPSSAHLHYHHEMAYVGRSVKNISFCADKATENKGAMYVSDNLTATDAILATDMGQKMKERGICYVRCLTDRDAYVGKSERGIYNHWQTSFGTEDPELVDRLAAERGLEVQWKESAEHGRFLVTKCYISAFEYFAPLDRNLLYSSVADDSIWFDAWPGVMELPTMPSVSEATADHRPLLLTYGDDSPMSYEDLKLFVDVYDRAAMPINWQVGDVLVVCNWRWAHGRPAYFLDEGEERNLGVVLGEMYDRVGQIEDKW